MSPCLLPRGSLVGGGCLGIAYPLPEDAVGTLLEGLPGIGGAAAAAACALGLGDLSIFFALQPVLPKQFRILLHPQRTMLEGLWVYEDTIVCVSEPHKVFMAIPSGRFRRSLVGCLDEHTPLDEAFHASQVRDLQLVVGDRELERLRDDTVLVYRAIRATDSRILHPI